MKNYTKKPVTIQALQVSPLNLHEVEQFVGGDLENRDGQLVIATLEGPMHVSLGDYIIRGVKGEFYPCKPDIFAETYGDAVEDEVNPEDFLGDLTSLLNRYCAEAPSGTPDYILASFLRGVLREFNEAVSLRATWRGESCELPSLQRGGLL